MRRFAVPAAIATVAVALLVLLASGLVDSGPNDSLAYSVASGHYRPAPGREVALPELPGDPVPGQPPRLRLADLRGRPVLINLFASWCDACKAEAPLLRQAQTVLQAHHGTVLGVVFQDSPDSALGFVRRYRVDYPVVADPNGTFAADYGVTNQGIPDTYLMDSRGRIVGINLFELTPDWIQHTLPRLLDRTTA